MTETFGEKEEKSEPPPAKELKTVKFTGKPAAEESTGDSGDVHQG